MVDNRSRRAAGTPPINGHPVDGTAQRYGEAIICRYLSERDRRPIAAAARGGIGGEEWSRTFCVHVVFFAGSHADARVRAVELVEALAILRSEVVQAHARLSHAGEWQDSQPLFCSAASPRGDRCAKVDGHGGFHHSGGFDRLAWVDEDRAER